MYQYTTCKYMRSTHHWVYESPLTHWGRVTPKCVGNVTIIGSDNGLLPDRHQAIIWTSARILLTGPLGTNFSEILIGIQTFSFMKMHLKMSSANWRPFCTGLNVLTCGPVWFPGWSNAIPTLFSCMARRPQWQICYTASVCNLISVSFGSRRL